jgi:pimeloyl-ACP methyl ester carboxylesterase
MTADLQMIGRAHETIVGDTPVAWGELGSGPPLVLLHGIMDSHRVWRRAAPLLAEHFRVLMPDLPGHGWSGRPDAPYTLPWHTAVLASWMDAIGVPRAHVCGHSFGGGIAQWMLLEQRTRIDRLALVSTGGLGRQVAVGMRFAAFPVLGRWLTPLAMRFAMPTVLRACSATFGHMEPEEIELFLQMRRIPGTNRAFQRSLEGVINLFGQYMQTMQRAHEIVSMPPVAIFWGDKDPIIPVRHGRAVLDHSTGVSLTEYDGCGHYPQLDVPSPFTRDLIGFLRSPDLPPARFSPARPRKGLVRVKSLWNRPSAEERGTLHKTFVPAHLAGARESAATRNESSAIH